MLWTRRAFLQTILAGTAGLVVIGKAGVLEKVLQPPAPEIAVFDPSRPFWVQEIMAYVPEVLVSSAEMCRVYFTRGGMGILHGGFQRRGGYRWVAMPSNEIYGPGLVNESDTDLDVSLVVQQGYSVYHIDKDGKARLMYTSVHVPDRLRDDPASRRSWYRYRRRLSRGA